MSIRTGLGQFTISPSGNQTGGQLCSRAPRLVWETIRRYPRADPGPFAIGPSGNRTGDPHFTSKGNCQILSQKDPLQAVGQLFGWELEGTGADAGNTTSAKHSFINLRPKLDYDPLALQGALQPHLLVRTCLIKQRNENIPQQHLWLLLE